MPSRKRLLLFLLLGFLTVAIGFIPDLVSEDLKPWCLQHFGPAYPWYMIGIFVVGCFVLLASSEFKDLLGFNERIKAQGQIKIAWSQAAIQHIKSARETIKEAKPEETIKALSNLKNAVVDEQLSMLSVRLAQYRQDSRLGTLNYEQKDTTLNRINKDILDLIKAIENQLAEGEKVNQQLRDAFRQRYRNRLSQKLASRQPVNLRRFASTEGTSEQVAATFIPYGSDQIRAEISKTFQDAYGRLLIVGQPGAGKTTLLLQLAETLFDLEEDALPVVLNLATWQSSFGKLETWLEAVLAAELSTNKAGAKAVLQQSNLILLLDGLDELKEDEAINSCLVAIADYGSVPGRRFVITCRVEEYKRVKEDARVNLQIEVGPLRKDQLEAELARMGREQPEALPLLLAIKKDPLLLQAAETPFYFNTMQLLFAGKLPTFATKDLENRRAEITNKFIASALQGMENKTYSPNSASHWLSFLASRMNQRNKIVFELSELQYDWNITWNRNEIFLPNFIFGIVVGSVGSFIYIFPIISLIIGGSVGVVFGITSGLIKGVTMGMSISILLTLIIGMLISLTEKSLPGIKTVDFLIWKKEEKSTWLKTVIFSFIISSPILFFASLYIKVLIIALALVLPTVILIFESIHNSYGRLILISHPYQRFIGSTKSFYFSIFQHWHLRYIFSKKGLLPKSLVKFLNEIVACNILETDGATWRFRHRIIQDYFAEQWVEPEDTKEALVNRADVGAEKRR